jgi:hypothetical protein
LSTISLKKLMLNTLQQNACPYAKLVQTLTVQEANVLRLEPHRVAVFAVVPSS